MDKYKQTIKTWDTLADIYEEKFMDIDLYNATYDFFCDQIKVQNPSILEIGCGPGNITRYIQNKRQDFKILATDVAPSMIIKAKENIPSAQFMVKDIRDIHEIDQKFDGIICGFCIPYIDMDEVIKFLDYCKKSLNKNGWLYMSFVDGPALQSGYISGNSSDHKVYLHYHPLEKIIEQLTERGFINQKTFVVDYPKKDFVEKHTIIIDRRQ